MIVLLLRLFKKHSLALQEVTRYLDSLIFARIILLSFYLVACVSAVTYSEFLYNQARFVNKARFAITKRASQNQRFAKKMFRFFAKIISICADVQNNRADNDVVVIPVVTF